MTDNEIIKALKEMLEVMLCEGDLQRSATISNAIYLINRQKAEIDNYSHNNRTMTKDIRKLQKALEQAKAEIERLQDVNIRLTKAEAIKEFAEGLKNPILSQLGISTMEKKEAYYFCLDEIDNLVEEMVGDAGE